MTHQPSQLQLPSDADRAGQTQPRLALAPFTAGHPDAHAIHTLTERLQTDAAQGQQPQQGTDLSPQAAGADADLSQKAESTIQGHLQDSRHAFDPPISPTDQDEQSTNQNQSCVPGRPNHSVQPAVAEAAEAAADVTAKPAVEAAHPGLPVLFTIPCLAVDVMFP